VTIGSRMTVRSGTREGGEDKGLGFFVLLGSHDSGTLASRQVQIRMPCWQRVEDGPSTHMVLGHAMLGRIENTGNTCDR